MLSFNNVKEKLRVPIDSITTFADPSVNFALQFQTTRGEDDGEGDDTPDPTPKGDSKDKKDDKDEKRGEVISLDMFRKK